MTPTLKSKNLDTSSTSSYRPVVVLTTISKIIERAAQRQLLEYMEQSLQLNPSNHAYRKHYSTSTTLMEILDEIHQGSEDRCITSLMAIDQSAAFDCVSRELLIQKLERYQIGTDARDWILGYLTFRTQYVVIGTGHSEMRQVDTGVPQGSVIGPLLYAIFMNDLSETVKDPNCTDIAHQDRSTLFGKQCSMCGTVSTYADDSTYAIAGRSRSSNQNKLKRSLDQMEKYLNDNRLVVHLDKTTLSECMIHQKRSKTQGQPPTLLVKDSNGEDKVVKDSNCLRILGANLQSNITWQAHLETREKAVLPGARKALGLLRHQGKNIPMSSRQTLARGLVLSKLYYLMPLCGGASNALLKKAQVLVNAAARWATGHTKRTKISTLMRSVGWFTVKEQIVITTAVQTWKLLHLRIPARPLERIEVSNDWKMIVQEPRLISSQEHLRWRSSRIWNDLPLEVREIQTISRFKRQVKKTIIERRSMTPD